MENQRIYCGSGKKADKYDIINISVCLSDLPKEFITDSKNGKKYINLKVVGKKEVDQWGKTHSVEVDTWKPETKAVTPVAPTLSPKDDSTDFLPF